jgi:hypothetical protein
MIPITDQEWEQLSKIYNEKIKAIRIKESADPKELRSIISKIDEVLNLAAFDHARAQYDFATKDACLETQTSRFFLEGKNTLTEKTGRGASGMSDEKAKQYARSHIENKGYVEAQIKAQYRLTYLKNIIFLMDQKRQLLMIMHGVNKIENSFNYIQ